MKHLTITFIGGGNMTRSLVVGLIASGYDPKKITVTNRGAEKLAFFRDQLGMPTTQNNREGASHADVLVLSVEPLQIKAVCEELKETIIDKRPLIISVINGATVGFMREIIGMEVPIVRAMPNTPASVGAGATGLYASASVSDEQKNTAEAIFRAAGMVLWLDGEDQINVVTAISGCGPAYVFLIMEAIQATGEAMGLSPEAARLLTLETVLGAARMAIETDQDVVQLRQFITAAGGSTERAINALEVGGIRSLMANAMNAARDRAEELAKKLSE